MPCLLDFYKNVDVEACAIQAAVLEEVTYAKVMKTGGEQALAKGKQGLKWISNQLGMRPPIDTRPAKSTSELVMQRAAHWKTQTKIAIDRKVLEILAEAHSTALERTTRKQDETDGDGAMAARSAACS